MGLISFGIEGVYGRIGWPAWWNLLWCIRGEFNFTRFLSKRLDESCFCLIMMEFTNFIFDEGLMDIGLVRGTFTWSNKGDTPSLFSIDRFLVSPD